MSVLLETSVGDLVLDLFTDEAPVATTNFVKLCKLKYYNFSIVHRVEPGFVVQMGDPTGTGQGGESVWGVLGGPRYFSPEIHPLRKHKRGIVSMAVLEDKGVAVAGSQFFITLSDGLDYLDGKQSVIGEVAEGWDTVDRMATAICDSDGRPLSDILVRHTIILHDPFADPARMHVPPESPLLPSIEQQQMMRIEAGDILEIGDAGKEEGRRREQEARAQALTLEMIGDLPYADVKPPDNILFVCKLNAVTRDDDLRTIFARFGTIVSCDIIKDQKTGDSLGYAFIEFEAKESCEEAYFKMDNVLIDDRRIHVDFSQSVSRLNGKWVRTARTDDIRQERKPGLQVRRGRYRDDAISGEASRGKQSYDFVFDASSAGPKGSNRPSKTSRSRGDRTDDRRHHSRSPDRLQSNSHRRRSRFDR
ncbi:Peptidyl-prolyl cis-trans isomerase-like 4 [Coemansia sp. RSA 1933]|nr:Peptidyl-prolyl cis-trans isomerase-like 4 [Coemansia sp. RSA 1933]